VCSRRGHITACSEAKDHAGSTRSCGGAAALPSSPPHLFIIGDHADRGAGAAGEIKRQAPRMMQLPPPQVGRVGPAGPTAGKLSCPLPKIKINNAARVPRYCRSSVASMIRTSGSAPLDDVLVHSASALACPSEGQAVQQHQLLRLLRRRFTRTDPQRVNCYRKCLFFHILFHTYHDR